MNIRQIGIAFISTVVICSFGTNVRAQSPYSDIYNRPTVSPYLNLLQGPNQFGVISPNYQTLVRPQLEAREIAQQQGQAISNLQQQVRRAQGTGGSAASGRTGHETRRLYYSHYYPGFAGLPRQ